MDTFLERYSLNAIAFRRLLAESSALMSGSAALALYLEQEGIEAGYEPDDMDVWISSTEWDEQLWTLPWTNFLLRSGYQVTENFRQLDQYQEYIDCIQRVLTFERDGKKVQLIVVCVTDLKEYVANHFDFSACMTWWSITSERFETIYPVLTRGKKMFIRGRSISQGDVARAEQRLEKYRSRGFELVEEPPPYYYVPDERLEVDIAVWEGVRAFDVWQYEEVGVADHLRRSEWNIVVGCGSSWGAYNRRSLIRYMEEHRTITDMGVLYDTPYRQTVVHEAWDLLAYSDYSVYRLVEGVEQTINDVPKTIYAMEAYSVEGWRLGVVAERIGHITEMIRMDGEEEEEEEEEEDEEEDEDEEDEDEDEEEEEEDDELLYLFADELGVDLDAPAVPVPAVPDAPGAPVPAPMSESELELYQQMMDWIGQP